MHVRTAGLRLSLAVALAGCQIGKGEHVVDDDGDHWTPLYDCDDQDAATHPYADELCDGADNDCDGLIDEEGAIDPTIWYADADADGYGARAYTWVRCDQPSGYVSESGDCDDLDPEINPDAIEACDEVDNDCDGDTDETGALYPDIWYADADGDGYGDPAVREETCAQPAGYVEDHSDCDDTTDVVHPGSQEVCDDYDVDEDCDGDSDDDDASALGQSDWYPDSDGDGYGDPDGTTTPSCDEPAGYSEDTLDCDDTARRVNPGEAEVCGDGIDNDCDGAIDDDDDDGVAVHWYADLDGDGFGDESAYLGELCTAPDDAVAEASHWDCDDSDASVNPGATEVWYDGVDQDCDDASDDDADVDGYDADSAGGGDCDDADDSVNPGELELCDDGLDNDCDGIIDACTVAATFWGSVMEDEAGTAVAGVGDVDGDGLDDLAIGAHREDTNGAGAGAVYVFTGSLSGTVGATDADATVLGEALGDHAGISLGGGGDVTGDGYDDLIVGAYGSATGGTNAGAAYLVAGPISGTVELTDAAGTYVGEAAGDLAGWSVALAGDVDGDGMVDLIVGAYEEDTAGATAGVAYLIKGPATGSTRLWAADARIEGEAAGDQAGFALAGPGDTDGDGLDDVIVGAPYEHGSGAYTGAAYVVRGDVRGTIDLAEADAKWMGENSGDLAGYAVGGGADIDGDGTADVIIGAPDHDRGGNGAGATYLVLGPTTGESDLGAAHAVLLGEDNDDYAGCAVDGAGDLNGDGQDDLIVGACLEDAGGSDAGAAYLVLGPISGTIDLSAADAKLEGENTGDWLGADVAGVGDPDGDGADDVLIGAPFADADDRDEGAAYLLTGAAW